VLLLMTGVHVTIDQAEDFKVMKRFT